MDNNSAEMIKMPDNSVIAFAECMDSMLNTRDMAVYIDCLTALRSKYAIILCVRDSTGSIPKDIFDNIRALGFSKLVIGKWKTYIGVIDRSNVLFDSGNEKDDLPVEISMEFLGQKLYALSEAHMTGNAKIILNDEDYSLNDIGLNIVVYSPVNNTVIDSVSYNSVSSKPTFYHKNLKIDTEFFNSHFYLADKSIRAWKMAYSRKYFSNSKIGAQEISNGYILPIKLNNNKPFGGVLDNDLKFVAGHLFYSHNAKTCSRHIWEGYSFNAEDADIIDETVIFGGATINHIGHQITESFAERIWWIVKNKNLNYKIAVIELWANENICWFKEFADLLGISADRIIVITKPTKFKKIIVPDQSATPYIWNENYQYTQEYIDVYDAIKSNLVPTEKKKIYLTKSKTRRNNVVGEDFFIDFYKRKGFEIINPEDYSLREKANILYGADEVVSQAGTNLLFLVFCKSDVKVTFLTKTTTDPLAFHSMINSVAHIDESNIYHVNTALQFLYDHGSYGVCWMGVTREFAQYVRDKYKEEIEITPDDYIRLHLYDYLNKCMGYFNDSEFFQYAKNQKMLTILQYMSEVFYGRKFDTENLDLTTNEDILRDKVKQLTSEVETLQKQSKQLTTDLNAAKKHISYIENSDTYKTSKSLEAISFSLEGQIEKLQQFMLRETELNSINNNLSKENEKLEASLKNLQDKYDEKIKQISELKANLTDEEKLYQKFTSEFNKLDSNINSLRSNESVLQRQLEESRKTLNTQNNEIFNLKNELSKLRLDIQTKEQKINECLKDNSTLMSEKQKLESDLNNAQGNLKELENEISEIKNSKYWKMTKPLRRNAEDKQ